MSVVTQLPLETPGVIRSDGDHRLTRSYHIDVGSITDSPALALLAGQVASTSGISIPATNEIFAPGVAVYAREFNLEPTPENREIWRCDVNYSAPDGGGGGTTIEFDLHPLLRPPRVSIDYMEKEYVIQEARNVEPLTAGDIGGVNYSRVANTLGPISNGMNQETIEPFLDVEWSGVMTIRRSVADLTALLQLNKTYRRTTNSELVLGLFAPRTLKYQVTRSSDELEQDDIPYYDIETSVEILENTDLKVQSTGLLYKITDLHNVPDTASPREGYRNKGPLTGEPVHIGTDGTRRPDPQTITYRHLTEAPYTTLVT